MKYLINESQKSRMVFNLIDNQLGEIGNLDWIKDVSVNYDNSFPNVPNHYLVTIYVNEDEFGNMNTFSRADLIWELKIKIQEIAFTVSNMISDDVRIRTKIVER